MPELTDVQRHALRTLQRFGTCLPFEIVNNDYSKGWETANDRREAEGLRVAKKLCRMGLAELCEAPGRTPSVYLTPKGKALLETPDA